MNRAILVVGGTLLATSKNHRSGAAATPALSQGTGYVLRRASLATHARFIAELAPLGLRPAEYAALLVIDGNPGARSADISALLGIEKANFTTFLRRLERRGWVRREPSATDGRAHALHLTAAGSVLLRAAEVLREAQEQAIATRLGALEHARLVELLQALLDGAEAPPPPLPARLSPASRPGPDRAG